MKLDLFKENRPGFSLIEIMAVLLIVSLGIIGVANLATQSIRAQMINKGNIIAYQLAQEGIEIVRQIRDTNWIQGEDWKTGIASGTYCADYVGPELRPASGPAECRLYLEDDTWYRSPEIVLSSMTGTPYRRVVTINAATSSMSVKAIVTWMERDRAFRYETETELYDWR